MLKMKLAAAILTCAAGLYAAEDADLRKLLPGVWLSTEKVQNNSSMSELEYKNDGTFIETVTMTLDGQKTVYTYEGKWTIQGGKLEMKVSKTSNEEFMKTGSLLRDEILELDAAAFKYKNTEREVITLKRKK